MELVTRVLLKTGKRHGNMVHTTLLLGSDAALTPAREETAQSKKGIMATMV